MSGVYIPNIEMPKSCDDCPHPTCTLWQSVNGGGRNEKCPIVSVPKHGSLIDANARVNVQIYNDEFEDFQTVNMSIDDLLDSSWIEIEDDPIIIPASGGKEDE